MASVDQLRDVGEVGVGVVCEGGGDDALHLVAGEPDDRAELGCDLLERHVDLDGLVGIGRIGLLAVDGPFIACFGETAMS